ncbi:MAG: YeaH/YhbH family protein [Hyphomonadaceae bacterium]|nr:YeaH/YhbH family protein [Hyphomonadaceae bacterium]
MHIIDRRLNPGGKSLSNRQRFMRRARAAVRNAVKEASKGRNIRDMDQGGEVSIPAGDVSEPVFRQSSEGGKRDHVLPGNKEYVEGDSIARPQGGGGGRGASADGMGEDEFRFVLSQEEFLDLFLEDLELPNLAKRQVTGEGAPAWRRAGFRSYGSPSAISIPRTLRHSLARRIALKRPGRGEIAALQEEIERLEKEGADEATLAPLREELERRTRRATVIPYVDPLDVRYRRYEQEPTPIAKAVMFCLMDVSGSMDEHMKDLSKRFFSLLYLFLKRRYEHVEVVFIRHAHMAQEVDEETFFHSRETGGTVVSTALAEMVKILQERYPLESWNIYAAQSSDGDNTASDNPRSLALLTESILPVVQYYAYLEVGSDDAQPAMPGTDRPTNLWRAYELIVGPKVPMSMRKVNHRRDIYPVFRELFQRQEAVTV